MFAVCYIKIYWLKINTLNLALDGSTKSAPMFQTQLPCFGIFARVCSLSVISSGTLEI